MSPDNLRFVRQQVREYLRRELSPHFPGNVVLRPHVETSEVGADKASAYVHCGLFHEGVDHGHVTFQLTCMPACPWVVVSHSLHISPNLRGKGLSAVLDNAKQFLAYHMGFKLMVCTVNPGNAAEMRCLTKYGWSTFTRPDVPVVLGMRQISLPLLGSDEE